MIKLSPDAEKILGSFANYPLLSREQRQRYRDLELSHGRFLRLFLFCIQDNLNSLCADDLDNIYLIISWSYESLYWARRSLHSKDPPRNYILPRNYTNVQYALNVDMNKNVLSEAYNLFLFRLTSYCPQGLLLDNTLVRLSQAYELAVEILKTANSIGSTKIKRKKIRGES
jgi:hypothetical protein